MKDTKTPRRIALDAETVTALDRRRKRALARAEPCRCELPPDSFVSSSTPEGSRPLHPGVPVRTVSGRLGHANAATTLNVYAHFLEASDRQAADIIGGLLVPPDRQQ